MKLVNIGSIRPTFVTKHIHKMHGCSAGSVATQCHLHFELQTRLADFDPVSKAWASTLRCHPSSSSVSGVETHTKKNVLSPAPTTMYLGFVVDPVTMQAQLSHTCVQSILSTLSNIRLGQQNTIHNFERILGLIATASSVIVLKFLHCLSCGSARYLCTVGFATSLCGSDPSSSPWVPLLMCVIITRC